MHGEIERPVDPESHPGRSSGERAQSQVETRHTHRVHFRETTPGNALHGGGRYCEDDSISFDGPEARYSLAQTDFDTHAPRPFLQTGGQGVPAPMKIKHPRVRRPPEVIQSRGGA